jgi:SAM-dependent methyltransferase
MRADDWYRAQSDFYAERRHHRLRASEGGRYAENLVARLWSALGAPRDADGVEVGCSAGRFTLPLLARCRSIQAIDLSRKQLDELRAELDRRDIDPARCRTHEVNVEQLGPELGEQCYDFVVGVFLLHHLHDPGRTLARLFRLLRPGGRVAFVEPNRWNPLYALQISLCPDMKWSQERGLYRLSKRGFAGMFEQAGFEDRDVSRFGFFPPQIVNRFPNALRWERSLERSRVLRPVLPFLIASGRRPDSD